MKELREIKLHRIKTEFTKFIKSLSFESYLGTNQYNYYNEYNRTVIVIMHKLKIIKIRTYLFPENISSLKMNDIIDIVYKEVGHREYKIKMYHIEKEDNSLL